MSQISCNYKNHNLGNVFETFKNKESNGIQTSILDLNQLFDERNPKVETELEENIKK